MRFSASHVATAAGAVLLLAVVTIVQGTWSERWIPVSKDAVNHAAKLLEERFPDRFGDWSLEQTIDSDPKQLEAARAVGHVSRLYRNGRSRSHISTFVVCALPYDASAHTPDRCYPGAGFTIEESEHRLRIDVGGEREVEAYTGTFGKAGQTLRIFWTYGVPGEKESAAPLEWVAPQLARIALSDKPAVYKLYVISDQTRIGATQSIAECENFIANLVPALDAALAGEASAAPEPTGADRPPAGDAAKVD